VSNALDQVQGRKFSVLASESSPNPRYSKELLNDRGRDHNWKKGEGLWTKSREMNELLFHHLVEGLDVLFCERTPLGDSGFRLSPMFLS
jgi:hypothetical protein